MNNQFQHDIQQADDLQEMGKTNAAYHAYRACLTRAKVEKLTISIEQLSMIWLGIGRCYAVRERWDRALQWYHLAKMGVLSTATFTPDPRSDKGVVRQAQWQPYAPSKVTITLDDATPHYALAMICEATAVACEHSDQANLAQLYAQQAEKLYKQAAPTAIDSDVLPAIVDKADEASAIVAKVDEPAADDGLNIPDIDPYELGPIRLGALRGPDDSFTILNHFGIRHFGATQRRWQVVEDELNFYEPDSAEASTVSGVTLNLYGEPARAVNISSTMFTCRVVEVEQRPLVDHEEPVFVAISDETLPLQMDTLMDYLEDLNLKL